MLSDRYGRKRVLSFSALLFAVSSLGAALPRDFVQFGVARFVGGIAIGVASMLAPLYIAEVSPARIRGRLVSLPWDAPGWIDKFYSKRMAGYVAGFIDGAKQTYELDIAYTGIWNETQYNANYVKTLRQVLDQHGLETKIVCCDEYPRADVDQWGILADMRKDADLRDAIAVVSVHYPRVDGKVTTPPSAREIGKPLWSSEDQLASSASYIHSRDWQVGGRELARLYNDNYLKGGFTATEIWSHVSSYYDILAAPNSGLMYANTPWSGNYRVQGAIWATAHTTQFTQPGWQYLDSSCGYLREKGDYVALKSPNERDWSVILQTIDAKHPRECAFALPAA